MAHIQIHTNRPGRGQFGMNWAVYKQTWWDRLWGRDGKLILNGWAPDRRTAEVQAASFYRHLCRVELHKVDL